MSSAAAPSPFLSHLLLRPASRHAALLAAAAPAENERTGSGPTPRHRRFAKQQHIVARGKLAAEASGRRPCPEEKPLFSPRKLRSTTRQHLNPHTHPQARAPTPEIKAPVRRRRVPKLHATLTLRNFLFLNQFAVLHRITPDVG